MVTARTTTRGAPGARSNLADRIYQRLKAEMNDFRVVPGDRLSEAEIGLRFGVSRTPVRQALFRLRDEGFLDVAAKSGWYVRPLDFAKLDDLYDLRITLELASVARLCARSRGSDAELDRLRATWLVPVSGRLEKRASEARNVPTEATRLSMAAARHDGVAARKIEAIRGMPRMSRISFTGDPPAHSR